MKLNDYNNVTTRRRRGIMLPQRVSKLSTYTTYTPPFGSVLLLGTGPCGRADLLGSSCGEGGLGRLVVPLAGGAVVIHLAISPRCFPLSRQRRSARLTSSSVTPELRATWTAAPTPTASAVRML